MAMNFISPGACSHSVLHMQASNGEAAAVRDNQAEIDEQLTPLLRAMVRCAALAVAVPFK